MPVEAILIDSGGVFLQPDADRLLALLGPYGATARTPEEVDRAHYAANNSTGGLDWRGYWRRLVEHLGVPERNADGAVDALHDAMDASWWNRTYADAVEGLRAIAGTGVRLAVVSNADGTAADLLRTAKICQVGDGSGVRIDAVIDSYVVGVEKPDPRIFEIALSEVDVPPERAMHIGDTLWADVRGAEAAGVRPVHFDPYGDCPEPDGHDHVRSLREVPALLR